MFGVFGRYPDRAVVEGILERFLGTPTTMGLDMEQGDVARWRQQMGQGIAPWASKPGMVGEVGATSWLMLTGAPSPDVNMALVYDDDPDVLSSVLKKIEQLGCPALVLLAGDGKTRAHDLAGAWEGVGEMPMMTAELTQAPHASDPRVRRAGPGDEEAVRDLIGEAYGLSPEIASICTEILQRPVDTMTIWLLEDDGRAVSTVTACRVQDVVDGAPRLVDSGA
jgi:isopentenyl diphosphate isomerase/L-lactate dehydrogenase-like FMN-dependent dehydrogenase